MPRYTIERANRSDRHISYDAYAENGVVEEERAAKEYRNQLACWDVMDERSPIRRAVAHDLERRDAELITNALNKED